MSRLALLPLDDRPVNYDHPWWLGRAAGIDVIRPVRDWLGNPFRTADSARLSTWLTKEGGAADAVVIAIDTLAYGGLIPSRQSDTPLDEVRRSLEPLRLLRAARPGLLIYAFSILMRINRSDSAEEEKAYWADHGRNLFRLSYLDDKANAGDASEDEVRERQVLFNLVPGSVVADYRAGRARNNAINRLMLEWAEQDLVSYIVIGQDDTAPYGWNIAESRALRDVIAQRGLRDRAIVYPGADEVGSLLIAAFACRSAGLKPRVFTRYSASDGPSMMTAYEDRPLEQLVQAHLGPLGGEMTGSADQANLVLAVNAPGVEQVDGWLQLAVREPELVAGRSGSSIDQQALDAVRREMTTPRKDVDRLTAEIEADLVADRNVAIVDVAFVNGADLALAERLMAQVSIVRLAAYAAWNTAGNSLGSALAQGVVRAITRGKELSDDVISAHVALLAIHFLDDYVYQGIVRTQIVLDDFHGLGLEPTFARLPEQLVPEIERRIGRRMAAHVDALERHLTMSTIANGAETRRVSALDISAPSLPWNRAFEIAITPRVEVT